MPLHDLPIEVIYTILRFVGSDSLRKHETCCLLVSKWWCKLAECVLLEDIVFGTDQLKRITDQGVERLAALSRRITIDVKPIPDLYADEELNNALGQLLPRCVKLKAFTLHAQSYFNPNEPLARYTNYLGLWAPTRLLDLLPFSLMSDLVIDTCGSDFKAGVHICPRLALRIPSLRSVRLRMHSICPRVLELEHDSKVESVIINLSLREVGRFHAGFSRHCTEPKSAYALRDEMIMAATNVARTHSSIKMLRILCHSHPYLEMETMDCLKGNRMILSDDGEWDWGDDGLPSPTDEEASDQDLFASDSEDGYLLT